MKTVIEMAREAGVISPEGYEGQWYWGYDCLERFADLVRADEGKRLMWACEQVRDPDESFEYLNGFDRCASELNAERIEI